MNSLQIVEKIQLKAQEQKTTVPQDYFVGITAKSIDKVLREHNLNKDKSFYTFYEAKSEIEAEKAFNKLLDIDMNGYPLNKENRGKTIYCYCIESSSKECSRNISN